MRFSTATPATTPEAFAGPCCAADNWPSTLIMAVTFTMCFAGFLVALRIWGPWRFRIAIAGEGALVHVGAPAELRELMGENYANFEKDYVKAKRAELRA
ncbi:hypothetical protein BJX64DRAFT_288536 [Aspergillus heterothallicus]